MSLRQRLAAAWAAFKNTGDPTGERNGFVGNDKADAGKANAADPTTSTPVGENTFRAMINGEERRVKPLSVSSPVHLTVQAIDRRGVISIKLITEDDVNADDIAKFREAMKRLA